jgi:centrosomal protein CEP41
MIIIYMFDERSGSQAAKMFAEKGFENIFLISGGIEQFTTEFPDMVEGLEVPQPAKVT